MTMINEIAIGRAGYWGRIGMLFIAVIFVEMLGMPELAILTQLGTVVAFIYFAYQRCLAIGWHGGWSVFGIFFLGIFVFGIVKGKDRYLGKEGELL